MIKSPIIIRDIEYDALRDIIMKQAKEKGWGTRPEEIDVPEKILLIGSEVCLEVNEAVTPYLVRLKEAENDANNRWMAMAGDEDLLMHRWCVSPYRGGAVSVEFGERQNYEEEWADALQRTLHLGGIFDVSFPSNYPEFNVTIPSIQQSDARFVQFSRKVFQTHDHYRNKKMEEFNNGLIWLAHYCAYVSIADGFDISETLMKKVEKNKSRTWSKADLNEKLRY